MSKTQINPSVTELTFPQQEHLLDELQNLLSKQLQLARQGDSTNKQFGILMSKASTLVKEIEQTGILDRSEYQYQREKLRKRYENLCLIIAAEKSNVCRDISQIHKGRKILETYHNNI